MKLIGIYKIQSTSNPERVYIGSSVNIKNRWDNHIYDLRHGKHHNIKMQRHFNKYGLSDLQFSIIEECPKDILIQREQFHIDTLKPWFNICPIAYSCIGLKHTEEVKAKIAYTKKEHAEINRLRRIEIKWAKEFCS
jgi:group I intron endonuclease